MVLRLFLILLLLLVPGLAPAAEGQLPVVTATAEYQGDWLGPWQNYIKSFDPAYAVDGNYLSMYSSNVNHWTDPSQWWQADLGQTCRITKIKLAWAPLFTEIGFKLVGSIDGAVFKELLPQTIMHSDGEARQFQVAGDARYVRLIYLSTTNGSQGLDLVELEIFGSAAQAVAVDIKPGACPNPLNVKSQGVLPVAILGNEGFDVTAIDPASVLLNGVAALHWSLEDVSEPANDSGCGDFGPDSFEDLVLKFDTQQLVATLGQVSHGDEAVLLLSGRLSDGRLIEGRDKVIIIKKGNGR